MDSFKEGTFTTAARNMHKKKRKEDHKRMKRRNKFLGEKKLVIHAGELYYLDLNK